MDIPKKVLIGNGKGSKKLYYLWEELNDGTKAKEMAIEIKNQYKKEGKCIKSFIIHYSHNMVGLYFTKEVKNE